jgi:hypothetical protein
MIVGYNAFEKEKSNYSHYQKNDVYDSVRVSHPHILYIVLVLYMIKVVYLIPSNMVIVRNTYPTPLLT